MDTQQKRIREWFDRNIALDIRDQLTGNNRYVRSVSLREAAKKYLF